MIAHMTLGTFEETRDAPSPTQFSPCDDIGPHTFESGNTFEICVCHRNPHCLKKRLVKKIRENKLLMVKSDEVDNSVHKRLVAEVQAEESSTVKWVKIRQMIDPEDSDLQYRLSLVGEQRSLPRRNIEENLVQTSNQKVEL
eukprot:00476.XXX_694_54_1 [CDS] Oithona nana genome sequencing.